MVNQLEITHFPVRYVSLPDGRFAIFSGSASTPRAPGISAH